MLLELENKEESKVFPHEKTHQKEVDDRLKLTRALSSNLSSIFVCYSDKQRKVEKIFNKHVIVQDPLIDIEDEGVMDLSDEHKEMLAELCKKVYMMESSTANMRLQRFIHEMRGVIGNIDDKFKDA